MHRFWNWENCPQGECGRDKYGRKTNTDRNGMKEFWQEGYDKWVSFRQSVFAAYGRDEITEADLLRILGDKVNMGRGDFFVSH